jgi:hypothetical protein
MSSPAQHQRYLLVLLVVLVLMQSFAIWHDTVHPYHDHVSQCERFEAFAHIPVLDSASNDLTVISLFVVAAIIILKSTFFGSSKRLSKQAIRAPPFIFS